LSEALFWEDALALHLIHMQLKRSCQKMLRFPIRS